MEPKNDYRDLCLGKYIYYQVLAPQLVLYNTAPCNYIVFTPSSHAPAAPHKNYKILIIL